MSYSLHTSLGRFKTISIIEGISSLVLFFIAMPIKYIFDMPEAVRYPGLVHGILFVLYIVILIETAIAYRWPFKMFILGALASIPPFGPFLFDKYCLPKLSSKQA